MYVCWDIVPSYRSSIRWVQKYGELECITTIAAVAVRHFLRPLEAPSFIRVVEAISPVSAIVEVLDKPVESTICHLYLLQHFFLSSQRRLGRQSAGMTGSISNIRPVRMFVSIGAKSIRNRHVPSKQFPRFASLHSASDHCCVSSAKQNQFEAFEVADLGRSELKHAGRTILACCSPWRL